MAAPGTTDGPFGGMTPDSRGAPPVGAFSLVPTTGGGQPPQTGGFCDSIDNFFLRQACKAGEGIIGGGGGGGGGLSEEQIRAQKCASAGGTYNFTTATCTGLTGGGGNCTPPLVFNSALGLCVQPGSPGAGGGGQAVIGAFGIPAQQPIVIGEIRNAPIRKCMPGAVLGKDNLCYMKGSIPRQFRKWKPTPRPIVSAADAKALRRIGTLQKKVKRLASSANLTCKKR